MPPHGLPTLLGVLVGIGVIDAGCLLIWFLVVSKSLVRYQPRRPVPWNGIDVAVVLLLALFSFLTAGALLQWTNGGPLPKQLNATVLAVNCAAEVVALALGVAWLMLRSRATWADLGLTGSRLGYFIGLGLLAYFVSVTPVQSLLEGLSKLFEQPYEHDVITALKAPGGFSRWAWAALAVVIVGPLSEEMFFRVILQGWLETIVWPGTRAFLTTTSATAAGEEAESPAAPVVWQPIVFSSGAFALMHSGLAQIPLFFFALVLGYLYQRTHRLWPSLVTHMLLNGGSLGMLWVLTHAQK